MPAISGPPPVPSPVLSPVFAPNWGTTPPSFQQPRGLDILQLVNSAEAGTAGLTVTTGNSGGPRDNAFDAVTIGATGVMAYDNTHVAHGATAFLVQQGGTAASTELKWNTSMGTQQKVWFRMYCYIPTFSTNWRCYEGRTSGGASSSILISPSGVISLQDGSFSTLVTFTNAVNLAGWFRLEGFIFGHPTSGQMQTQLFNSPESLIPTETQTSAVGANTGGGPLTEHWFGQMAGVANTGPFWFDSIGISNGGPLGPVGYETTRTLPGSMPKRFFVLPVLPWRNSRRMPPIPALVMAKQVARRQSAAIPVRHQTMLIQQAVVVTAPPVQQVQVGTKARWAEIRRRPRASMPLRFQVSGPPPAIPRVGPYARWAELRRRPRAIMPAPLQVSGPLPAVTRVGTKPRLAELRRRSRANWQTPLQVSGPFLPPARPTRRFVAYPSRAIRRQLSLPVPFPPFGRRVVVPLPWLRPRRITQLVPPVVVIVQPFTQQEPLPRKAAWFGVRPIRRASLPPPGAAPVQTPTVLRVSTPRRLAGHRAPTRARLVPSGQAPPSQAPARRRIGAAPQRRPASQRPAPLVVPAQTPARRRLGIAMFRRAPGQRPAPAGPPTQAPGRRRVALAPARRGARQIPPPLHRPPHGRPNRPRLAAFLRRIRQLSLNIFGAAPVISNFPGLVSITNRNAEPITLLQSAPAVAIADSQVGALSIADTAPGVTIANTEAGSVGVRNI
jgi:hypothetical protein